MEAAHDLPIIKIRWLYAITMCNTIFSDYAKQLGTDRKDLTYLRKDDRKPIKEEDGNMMMDEELIKRHKEVAKGKRGYLLCLSSPS